MTNSGTPTRGTNYSLAVDLGTSFVAAAVARGDQVEMVALGDRSIVMPSVIYAREDGALPAFLASGHAQRALKVAQ